MYLCDLVDLLRVAVMCGGGDNVCVCANRAQKYNVMREHPTQR